MTQNKKNIICFVGSLNQTSQLHQISEYLTDDYNIYYTQVFGSGMVYKFLAEIGIFDNTVFGKNSSFTKASQEYIRKHNLKYDYRGMSKGITYHMAILSTDMLVPQSFNALKKVWIQEGMIDPLTNMSYLAKKLGLPAYITGNTSLNGTTNIADIYFSMSKGYKDYFTQYGTEKNKILATGIPNFDNIEALSNTTYHESGYVLIATSDIRELGGNDDRTYLYKKASEIANGKKIIVKPHPNENLERVKREVSYAIPNAEIITDPIIDTLIAHCDILITQFSSTAYIGLTLGKKVYSYFPIEELKAKKPIQNGGKSAKIIADITREYLEYDGIKEDFIKQSKLAQNYL